MTLVPSGSPFWARTNTFDVYGGALAKAEYSGMPALGNHDLGADDFNRLAVDQAAIGKTIPFCVITFTTNGATSADPTVTYCAIPTGLTVVPYDGGNPPSGMPLVQQSATYDATITFDSSYTDPYGVAQSYTPTFAQPTINDVIYIKSVRAWCSGSVVTVNMYSSPLSDTTITVEVF